MAKTASNRAGWIYFRNQVQMKRLTVNSTIAKMLYFCDSISAAFSSMPSAMKIRVPYWMMNVQHVTWAPT